MNRVESRFQRFSSALPLAAETNERFSAGCPGSVFQSVMRTMRFPKSGSVTIVLAPTRFPTLGMDEGIWTISKSVREQLYAGGPQVRPEVETKRERLCCAVCEAASVLRTLKVKVPALVADPDSVPVLEASCSPGGREPERMLHW